MEHTSFRSSQIVLPDSVRELFAVGVSDGRIVDLSCEDSGQRASSGVDFDSVTVFPGFVDVHIHGAIGIDVNQADADGLLQIAGFLAKHGVTSWVPTLVPDADANYQRAIDAIDELMCRQVDLPVAQAVGVHYEGVFASEKMCGALRPEYFRSWPGVQSDAGERTTPSTQSGGHPSFVRRGAVGLPRLENGIHMTTLAPEIDGGIELIEALVAEGWVVSIGHTKADSETLDRAFAAGARHMTHFFNAMTGINHRDLGVAGWGLANEGVTFDIIADGIHVHPKMLGVACRAKTPDNVSLISDSVAPTGLGDGEYELWGEKITVSNGRTQNERGSIAGSVITMHDAAKRMLSLGFTETEVARIASANPNKLLGLFDRGSIEIGKRADLVGIGQNGDVVFTMIGGQIVSVAQA